MTGMRPDKSHIFKTTSLTISKTFVCSFFLLIFIVSCNNDKPDKIGAVVDRTKLPKLQATEVTTLISDSGITRYRITAPRWNIYDKAVKPYQEFPDGIYFEKFDANMKVDANIQSNYARFNDTEQLWILRGKVRAMNLQGELFETEELFWDQRQAKFYSDSVINITETNGIIHGGKGFESNETMTYYKIKDTRAGLPFNENAQSSAPTSPKPVTTANATAPKIPASKTATFIPIKTSSFIAPPFHKTK